MAIVKGVKAYMISEDSDASPIAHYEALHRSPEGRGKAYFAAKPGMNICPRIKIPADFEWHDANALMVEIYHNSSCPLVGLPIMRRSSESSITVDLRKWPVWKNGKWLDATFSFKGAVQAESSQSNDHETSDRGMIRIALRRVRVLEFSDEANTFKNIAQRVPYLAKAKQSGGDSQPAPSLRIVPTYYRHSLKGRMPCIVKETGAQKGLRFNLRLEYRLESYFEDSANEFRAISLHMASAGKVPSFYSYFKSSTAWDPLTLFQGYAEDADTRRALALEIRAGHACGSLLQPVTEDTAALTDGCVVPPTSSVATGIEGTEVNGKDKVESLHDARVQLEIGPEASTSEPELDHLAKISSSIADVGRDPVISNSNLESSLTSEAVAGEDDDEIIWIETKTLSTPLTGSVPVITPGSLKRSASTELMADERDSRYRILMYEIEQGRLELERIQAETRQSRLIAELEQLGQAPSMGMKQSTIKEEPM